MAAPLLTAPMIEGLHSVLGQYLDPAPGEPFDILTPLPVAVPALSDAVLLEAQFDSTFRQLLAGVSTSPSGTDVAYSWEVDGTPCWTLNAAASTGIATLMPVRKLFQPPSSFRLRATNRTAGVVGVQMRAFGYSLKGNPLRPKRDGWPQGG